MLILVLAPFLRRIVGSYKKKATQVETNAGRKFANAVLLLAVASTLQIECTLRR